VINLFVFWLFQIPLAHLLATRTGLEPLGVAAALAISLLHAGRGQRHHLPARAVEE